MLWLLLLVMYKVVAHSDGFIYVLDTINNRLRSYQLNHSPGHIAEEFCRVPKVKNFEEAIKKIK